MLLLKPIKISKIFFFDVQIGVPTERNRIYSIIIHSFYNKNSLLYNNY